MTPGRGGDRLLWTAAAAAGLLAVGLGAWGVIDDHPRPVSPTWTLVVRVPVPVLPPPPAVPPRPELVEAIPQIGEPEPGTPIESIAEPVPMLAYETREPVPEDRGDPGTVAPPTSVPSSALPPPMAPSVQGDAAPWRANAVAGEVVPGHPTIAIVIDDMGLDRRRSARAAGLPGPLTLSWLPYADDLPAQTAAARARGHELMLHLPMEPSVKADPGPDAMLVDLSPDEALRRLDRALSRVPGIVGVNNHMGSRFTADRVAMTPVLTEIGRRGYLWLDSKTTAQSAGPALAAALGMPWVERDVFLDHVMFPAEVAKALARLEAVARRTGTAVAIGHPHDVTLNALERWLPELSRRGVTLAPLSAIVRARYARETRESAHDVRGR